MTWSCEGYNNTKLPKAWLWPQSLDPQPRVLTKELEIGVAASESECDILRAAGVLKFPGLPYVGFHHMIAHDRRWVLIWNTERELGSEAGPFLAYGSLFSFSGPLAYVRHSQSCDPPLERGIIRGFCSQTLCRADRSRTAHLAKSLLFLYLLSKQDSNSFMIRVLCWAWYKVN